MSTIKRFEDIQAWQSARLLCSEINNIIETTELKKDFSLKDQINRSSGSVMDNIAEGFGRGGNIEFINFLSIAHGSVCETQSQLYRILDKKYIANELFEKLYALSLEVKNKIRALIQYLQQSNIKGPKFIGR
jgi:four helix bundle protein